MATKPEDRRCRTRSIPRAKDHVRAGVALCDSPWRERLVWTRKIRKSCIWKVVYKLVLKEMDHLKKKEWK